MIIVIVTARVHFIIRKPDAQKCMVTQREWYNEANGEVV
jgi:hypothetical protein